MLVVAVISVDAYPFLVFSDLTCYLGSFWFFKLGFTLCKAGQPLQGMGVQEKETQKD